MEIPIVVNWTQKTVNCWTEKYLKIVDTNIDNLTAMILNERIPNSYFKIDEQGDPFLYINFNEDNYCKNDKKVKYQSAQHFVFQCRIFYLKKNYPEITGTKVFIDKALDNSRWNLLFFYNNNSI